MSSSFTKYQRQKGDERKRGWLDFYEDKGEIIDRTRTMNWGKFGFTQIGSY